MKISYDTIILIYNIYIMSTISVPLTPELEKHLKELAEETGASRAAVVRNALKWYHEERAIQKVLDAEQEYHKGRGLRGDFKTLIAK
jgi:predicted transcriptional regulator